MSETQQQPQQQQQQSAFVLQQAAQLMPRFLHQAAPSNAPTQPQAVGQFPRIRFIRPVAPTWPMNNAGGGEDGSVAVKMDATDCQQQQQPQQQRQLIIQPFPPSSSIVRCQGSAIVGNQPQQVFTLPTQQVAHRPILVSPTSATESTTTVSFSLLSMLNVDFTDQ